MTRLLVKAWRRVRGACTHCGSTCWTMEDVPPYHYRCVQCGEMEYVGS